MLRRDALRAGVTVGTVAVTGCLDAPANEVAFAEGFEDGMGEWETGAAIGPEVDVEEFEWEVDVSDAEAVEGTRSLRVWNEGDHDDGTTWAVHPVSVEPERAYRATVTARLWSESKSFNTIRDAVMRLGPTPPESEEDFPHPGVTTTPLGETPYGGLREPLWLADGWREYTFEWTSPRLSTDTLFVAVGTSVVWESAVTHYVDDLTVELEPR